MRKRINVIVIVLVSMLAGSLVMPAIARLRENSFDYHGTCKYRSIGLALQNHHDIYGFFPAAAVPNANLPPEHRLSWFVDILPWLEKSDVFQEIHREAAWDARENRPPVYRTIETYLCAANPNQPVPGEPAPTHYVGIAGVGLDAARLPADSPKAGMFGYDRKPKLRDVSDGTSNTMWLIGTASMNGPWAAGGPASVREVVPCLRPYLGKHRPFGGVHRGGVRVGLVDGSVRILNPSVSPEIFEALATYAGGEQVPGDL